jgi:hypothetical protein
MPQLVALPISFFSSFSYRRQLPGAWGGKKKKKHMMITTECSKYSKNPHVRYRTDTICAGGTFFCSMAWPLVGLSHLRAIFLLLCLFDSDGWIEWLESHVFKEQATMMDGKENVGF